jgi:hypothetical protein
LDKSYRSAIGQDKARTFMRAGGMMHWELQWWYASFVYRARSLSIDPFPELHYGSRQWNDENSLQDRPSAFISTTWTFVEWCYLKTSSAGCHCM